MNIEEYLHSGRCEEVFSSLYGSDCILKSQKRYFQLADGFLRHFGNRNNLQFYSAPGRTEIGGNHTDHQQGCVLAAAVHLDVVAAVAKREDGMIRFCSEGFGEIDQVNTLESDYRKEESGTSASLLRGICSRMKQLGFRVGGFDAYSVSDVPMGSGLSSSAAFEVLIVTILSHLYNNGEVDVISAAMIAQYAEARYFGKPCGLMDQMACSVGGVVAMDFQDPGHPKIQKITFSPKSFGYLLCIVNTGGNHAGLTEEYAMVSNEMRAVARLLGHTVLRECGEDQFYRQLPLLRGKLGERAILRAIHFFEENRRVMGEKEDLLTGDIEAFLKKVFQSGQSSFQYLQNVFACSDPQHQELALALALSQKLLEDKKGAWRVHGGGFAGTIQAFVPIDSYEDYKKRMETVFGIGCCQPLSIRGQGGIRVF